MSKTTNKVNHYDLKGIKDPKFLAYLSKKELYVLAEDIRVEILRATSLYGGHLSSNLGTVELTIALNRVFDFSKDKIIFDVGHQSYTYKILTGRSLENLRTKDGISGFQKISESPYDVYEAGHSSTSISAAEGFAIARDLNHEKYNVVAVIGDSSIVSGLAFEGLNDLASSSHKVIVILNDNGMSISKPQGGLSKLFANISSAAGYNRSKARYKRIMNRTKFGRWIYSWTSAIKNWFKHKLVKANVFDTMGLVYIGPVDGHNIKAMERAFKRANNTPKSVVIHVCTQKGKGYKPAENDTNGYWHGVTPFEIETGEPKVQHEGQNSWSHIFSDLTEKMMTEHDDAYLISPATQHGSGLDKVFAIYSERCSDVGIAEEHALTMASGLAVAGHHPIVSIYSTFMQRGFDQISHDLARMKCNSTILVERAGLVGADGETHQGLYDVSFLANTPNTVVTMPSTVEEALALYKESFNNHGPFFIRIPRAITEYNGTINDINVEFGRFMKIKEGSTTRTALIGIGPLFREVASIVAKKNITLYNALYISPINELDVDELLKFETIVIYDPYGTSGGFVDPLMAKLLQKGFKGEIKAFTVPTEFVKQATIKEQLEQFGLLPEQIVKNI